MKKIRLVNINTTAFSEENFSLITDLTDEQIIPIITPIVLRERNGVAEYDNDDLVGVLTRTYPDNYIQMVVDADKITV